LIPDFVPVLGYSDGLTIAPLGIALAIRMIPEDAMAECREAAQGAIGQDRPTSWTAALVITAIWLLIAALDVGILFRVLQD
jgi:uncharacterized membrane protein YkvA (DUF1232 family)